MADQNDSQQSPADHRRRSSFAGQAFADLFGTVKNRNSGSLNNNSNNATSTTTSQFPGPITSAAVQAHQRRVSLSTMSMSASPTQSSSYHRRDSISSAYSTTIDESAVEEEVGPPQNQPNTPFGRRASFGARALRDVQTGGSSGGGGADRSNGRASIAETGVTPLSPAVDGGKKTTPPTAKGRGLSSSP